LEPNFPASSRFAKSASEFPEQRGRAAFPLAFAIASDLKCVSVLF